VNIRRTEILLNILILVAVLVLVYVVGYPQLREARPSKVRIGAGKDHSIFFQVRAGRARRGVSGALRSRFYRD